MSGTTIGSFIAGGSAACGAVTVSHAFETIKIRLQLQGELQAKKDAPRIYRGVFHGIGVVLRNEGPRGLFRGLVCAYSYQMVINGCRLGFYEPIRAYLTTAALGDSRRQSIALNMTSGASTGVIAAALGSPLFLVKTRLQSASKFLPVGTQYDYRNARNGLTQIYQSEGVRGLCRGAVPAMVRTGFGSSVQLPTYFYAKGRLQSYLNEGPVLHVTSGMASGFVVCCFMHPPDTIMARMYNQSGRLYSSAVDCLVRTVRTEGLMALYKGFWAHLARIGPHTVLTLSFAEQTNKVMRKIETYVLSDSRTVA